MDSSAAVEDVLAEVVGAREVVDPRIRLKSENRGGRIVAALTRQPGRVHAWKVVTFRRRAQQH